MERHRTRREALAARTGAVAIVVALGMLPGATLALGSTSARPTSFGIRGSVSALFPGATKPLVLTITNPFTHWIVVTSVTTTVADANARCLAGNLRVARFTGRLGIGAHSSRRIRVTTTLLRGAPNACQRARFPLHYRGIAVRH